MTLVEERTLLQYEKCYLSREDAGLLGGVVLGVRADRSTTDVLDGDVLDVESNVVSGDSLRERLVVHLHRLHFSGDVLRSEGDDHTGLDNTSLNTAHGNSSNTSDLVHVLKGQTKRSVGRARRGDDGIESLQKSLSRSVSFGTLDSPSLEPGHVRGGLKHVVSVESGNRHEGDSLGVVADLLDEVGNLSLDFSETGLGEGRFSGVHLVAGNDELFHSQRLGEQGMLTGLSVLGNSGLKLSGTASHHKDGAVSLRGS